MVIDIYLYAPAVPKNDIILSRGLRIVRHGKGHYPTLVRLIREEEKVVATSLMSDLITRYGPVEGAQVYFKMERERKGPFQEGAKYADQRLGVANPQAAKSGEQMIAEAFRVRSKMAAVRAAKKR